MPLGLVKYSPDQPRDDHGRWTDAGGGGGERDAMPTLTPFGVITAPPHQAMSFRGVAAEHGLRTITSLPTDVTSDEKLGFKRIVDMTPTQAEGVASALDDVKREAPGFYQLVKDKVQFAAIEALPGEGGMTAFDPSHDPIIVLNTNLTEKVFSAANQNHSIANQMGEATGTRGVGTAYERELYRGIVTHELGHLYDAALGQPIATSIAVGVSLAPNPTAALKQFAKEVSRYATADPDEAAAEVFTMVVQHRPIPRALTNVAEHIRRTFKMPYQGQVGTSS
jgi:hypothetical protein